MAYFIKTPIGRDLLLGPDLDHPTPAAVSQYQRDTILKVLYDDHYAIFSDGQTPTSLRLLAQGLGFDPRRTSDLCEMLANDRLIEIIAIGEQRYYRITARGIEFVENAGSGEVLP